MSGEAEVPGPVECDRLLELLQDYLKGELDASMVPALEAHLAGCKSCFQSAAFERNFVALVSGRAAAAARCPDALRTRVLTALRSSSPA